MTVDMDNPFLMPLEASESPINVKGVIAEMLSLAEGIKVNTEQSYRKITSMYKHAREWKKAIDVKRKEMVEPYRKQTALINDKAKEITDPLDRVIDLANTKVAGYQKMLEIAKQEEEDSLRAAAALFDAEDEVYVAPLEKTIRGDGAIAVTKTEMKFKVMDLGKVPLKYLQINEEAVEQAIKLGVFEIPGIDIFETKTTKLRIR